jgi:hypothetical protein
MIVVVSGAPRSGTSLMMQMLVAGGLVALTDGERATDADNPRGYFEWEAAKQLPREPQLIAQAEGGVVKVISSLVPSLPAGFQYKVIFMLRPLEQVAASQAAMIARRGMPGASVPVAAMRSALESHVAQTISYIRRRPEMELLTVDYEAVLTDGVSRCAAIRAFVGVELDVTAMMSAVDPSLHHHHRV